jgi:hypothetical protein
MHELIPDFHLLSVYYSSQPVTDAVNICSPVS